MAYDWYWYDKDSFEKGMDIGMHIYYERKRIISFAVIFICTLGVILGLNHLWFAKCDEERQLIFTENTYGMVIYEGETIEQTFQSEDGYLESVLVLTAQGSENDKITVTLFDQEHHELASRYMTMDSSVGMLKADFRKKLHPGTFYHISILFEDINNGYSIYFVPTEDLPKSYGHCTLNEEVMDAALFVWFDYSIFRWDLFLVFLVPVFILGIFFLFDFSNNMISRIADGIGTVCCTLLCINSVNYLGTSTSQVDNIFMLERAWIITVLLVLILIALFTVIVRRLNVGIIIALSVCYLYGLISHFVILFRGTPFLPVDIFAISTAKAVASNYIYTLDDRDQDIPMGTEVQKLAGEYGVEITDWTDIPAIRLGVDGEDQIKKESAVGIMLSYEYKEVASSDLFLPASAYTAFTGEELPLPHGSIAAVSNPEGIPRLSVGVTLLTNTLTGRTLPVDSVLSLENDALSDCYVLNDEDFISMNEGLTDEWREMLCLFNVEDCGGSYDFAKALLYDIIDRSGEEVALFNGWDPVRRQIDIERTGEYFLDSEHLEEYGFSRIRYEERDSTVFRLYWAYMPKFRVLDRMDFVKTLAVFLMLFVFISLVCFAAVFVIAFTRTMTIALTGKGLYEDLRRLGASNAYLYRTVRSQAKRVFVTPAVIGTGIIYLFYVMMLYFNDGRISVQEWAGLSCCGLLTALVFCVYYGIYRITLQKACRVLNIK